MITLIVDESYAFDYMAILEVKYKMDPDNKDKQANLTACKAHIREQVGIDLYNIIVHSDEYRECFNANKETFLAVDDAKKDKVKASYVDKCNYRRFQAKNKLQEKFFSDKITEIKIGYELYEKDK